MRLRRWTPLTYLFPRRYLDTEYAWSDFDLHEWAAERYEWTQDPWNGFRDFASRPRETIDRERGDCEDFALVAMSWAVANDRPGVGLGFCWEQWRPWPTHVIAYDDEAVYSSGHVERTTVDDWLRDSRYTWVLRRRVGRPAT